MKKRTTIQIEATTLYRFNAVSRIAAGETNDSVLNRLISLSGAESRCQICDLMCKEDILPVSLPRNQERTTKRPRRGSGAFEHPDNVCWAHKAGAGTIRSSKIGEHPPYPAMEWSKKDAEADYKKWKKEYG
jgi:hypothetical protein